jgi:hypothetical protein
MKALLVQLVERRSPKPNVVGSSPTERVINIDSMINETFYRNMLSPLHENGEENI